MDRFSTKNTLEREDEEAERLVRTMPKVKPPRYDRRRETVQERDPDTSGDPDLASDPDLKMNFKDVGGSMQERVIIRAKDKKRRVKVRKKENDWVGWVSEDTLKGSPSEFEEVKDEEDPEPEKTKFEEEVPTSGGDEKPPSGAAPDSEEDLKAKESLQAMAKADEEFGTVLKDFTNPKSDVFQFAKGAPNTPAKQFLRGRTPPKGVTTLGDLQRVLLLKDAPKPKAPTALPTVPDAAANPVVAPEAKPQGTPEAPPSKEAPAQASPPSAEAPKQETPEAKKPKSKGKKPAKTEQPKPEEPKGRPVTKAEKTAATNEIVMTFPPKVAADLLLKNLHPDEVKALVADYHVAKALPTGLNDLDKLKANVSKFYTTDPDKVPAPRAIKSADGKSETAFEDLNPEDQARELRKHQIRTVAMSIAGRELLTHGLAKEAGAPEDLADSLANFMLSSRDAPDDARQAQAAQDAEKLFYRGLEASESSKVTPEVVKKVLGATKDPAAQRLAVGYFQAQDYQHARATYLDPKSEHHISEHQSPEAIARGLLKAADYLRRRTKEYPEGTAAQDTALAFRNRVMKHLAALVPEKQEKIQERLDESDNAQYEDDVRTHKRAVAKYEVKRKKAEEDYHQDYQQYFLDPDRNELPQGVTARLEAKGVRQPLEPMKPPRYDLQRKKPQALGEAASSMWDDFTSRAASLRSNPLSVRVAVRHLFAPFSIYPESSAMGHQRQAVYWGVEPYPKGHEGFEPYTGWMQPQARDLGEQDFSRILTGARTWLKTPVLADDIEGIVRDTQLRAALDLAIRTEGYEGCLHPTLYDDLLARLAGVSTDETLLTIRNATAAVHEGTRIRADGTTLEVEAVFSPGWVVGQNTNGNFVVCSLNPHKNKWEGVEWFNGDEFDEAVNAAERRMSKTVRNGMTMPKFSAESADTILARLDRLATVIQERREAWGLSKTAAAEIVTELDKTADEIEAAVYGPESLESRKAEIILTAAVLQRDPDEKYMDTFKSPLAPLQTEADEPYMKAYKVDQSAVVQDGKSDTGRALAP